MGFCSPFTTLLLLLSCFHVSLNISASNLTHHHPLCHDNERSALLQFKQSFIVDVHASSVHDPSAYPKVESWKPSTTSDDDCCLWDGVECDGITGHVVGLHLSSCFLYGSINPTSSLFHLVHLRKLNLSFNHFNYSLIPSTFSYLSQLTSLDLSNSFFSGQIPSNISDLSNLSSLDLSHNHQLVLKKPGFASLVQNLTSLQVLRLDSVDISSPVPDFLSNFSSLMALSLSDCGLYSKLPFRILQLPKLELLSLDSNPNLIGNLSEIHSISSPLRELYFDSCNFTGRFPSSFGNLTRLEYLALSSNPLDPQNLASLSWISNMTRLSYLHLHHNQLIGTIPSWFMNLTKLTNLGLGYNRLQGLIPRSISLLINLESINLSSNELNGTVEFDLFLKLEKLHVLGLSGNSISLVTSTISNASTVQKFSILGFSSCNLNAFPDFLRHHNKLEFLDLSSNSISGQIPKWLMNISTDTLKVIELSNNFLTSFEVNPVVFQWRKVLSIDLSNNLLQASLPIPPPSIQIYSVEGNKLTGEISPSFCNLTSLYVLLVGKNNLSGAIPTCLSNSFGLMEVLGLDSNNFRGTIPPALTNACTLKMITLNHNQFQGKVPRWLAHCEMLEFLDLGNNQINDVFPSWLGALPNLEVLILRSNQLHGVIIGKGFAFQRMHIIDLSRNYFSGQLPTQYFLNWIDMKTAVANQSTTYMQEFHYLSADKRVQYGYMYTMSITNKGSELKYGNILDFFTAIDLSCNKFEGDIPQVIGNLKGLHLLNLSNNILTGPIPPSLGNLAQLESLDLSQNNLSGEIPQQLVQLNFLSVFNVSHNHLSGPIPQGKQFDTFLNDSFEGNPGLCGKMMANKCANSVSSSEDDDDDDDDDQDSLKFGWKPVVIGYGCGLVIGLVIGHIVGTRKYDWLIKTFRIRPQRRARGRGRGGRRRN